MIFNKLHFTAVTWLPRIALLTFLRCLILLHFHQSFTLGIQLIHPFQASSGYQYPNPFFPTPWGFNSERLALLAYGQFRWLGWHSAGWWMEGTKAKVKRSQRHKDSELLQMDVQKCGHHWCFFFQHLHLLIFFGWFPNVQVTYSISPTCWCFASRQIRYTFSMSKRRKRRFVTPICVAWDLVPSYQNGLSHLVLNLKSISQKSLWHPVTSFGSSFLTISLFGRIAWLQLIDW